MGTLLDLIRRLFGARDQQSPPVAPRGPSPVEPPHPEPISSPDASPIAEPAHEPDLVPTDPLAVHPRVAAVAEPTPEPEAVHFEFEPVPTAPELNPPIAEPVAEAELVTSDPLAPEAPAAPLALVAEPTPEPISEPEPEPERFPTDRTGAGKGGQAPARSSPEPVPFSSDHTREEIALESEPEPAPILEPEPVAAESVAAVEPPPVSRAPLGLAGDLAAPLLDWRGNDPTPPGRLESPTPETPASRPEDAAALRRAAAIQLRAERAAAIAHRRATDILFLGRGVSEALNDRVGDHDTLDRLGLPRLDSPADLAARLEISVSRLRWLAFHAEVATRVHYVGFDVPKKGGGTRRLSAPHLSLARAQRWVFEAVVARLPVEDSAHGFVPGRSIVTNAREHSGRALVVNMDLTDFFPSIGWRRVRAVFEQVGYSPAIATILALLCTESPRRTVTLAGETLYVANGPRGLPQGACTSPGLSNQVARRLDRRLLGLAAKLEATYTRYADDLTFSGASGLDPLVGYLMTRVRRIAASEGFAVNEAKSRVLRQNRAQVVTGLVVNDRPGVARVEVRRLRAILHRARLEGLEAQNRAGHPDFRSWLLGKIAFVAMARPETGAQLLAEYRALDQV